LIFQLNCKIAKNPRIKTISKKKERNYGRTGNTATKMIVTCNYVSRHLLFLGTPAQFQTINYVDTRNIHPPQISYATLFRHVTHLDRNTIIKQIGFKILGKVKLRAFSVTISSENQQFTIHLPYNKSSSPLPQPTKCFDNQYHITYHIEFRVYRGNLLQTIPFPKRSWTPIILV
jgi:hypothetical protein